MPPSQVRRSTISWPSNWRLGVSRRRRRGFAIAAVALAVLGLYGLMAVTVAGAYARWRAARPWCIPGAGRPVVIVESLGYAGVGVELAWSSRSGCRLVEHLLVDVSASDPGRWRPLRWSC